MVPTWPTVVSDMGEQWSPKTPPQVTAAIAGYTDASSDNAMGIAMGIKIPKVPQEVPVEKAVKDAATKTETYIKDGVMKLSVAMTMYAEVPTDLAAPPIAHARIKIRMASSI